jgi:uncharacterized protein (DUF885 family)
MPTYDDDFVQEFLDAAQRTNPEVVTFLGSRYEDRLPDPSPEGFENKRTFVQTWKQRVAALDRANLDDEKRLDLEIFTRAADLWLYNLDQLSAVKHNPDPLEELSFLLFTDTRRESRDNEVRFQAIARRLEGFGKYLDRFHERVTLADTRWATMALKVATTFPAFLNTIRERAQSAVSPGLQRDLHQVLDHAHESLESHHGWIEHLPRQDDLWRLDPERFATLLRLKGIEQAPDELEEMGLEALRTLQAERQRLTQVLDPSLDVEGLRQRLHKDRPDNFAEILDEVRTLVQEAREFMQANAIASAQPWEKLEITPTPPFFRALIPATAYFSPTRNDEVQLGTYVVTPPAAPSLLEEYARSTLPLIAMHEAYPGHHHHIVSVNRLSSVLRDGGVFGFPTDPACWFGSELVEGWAYYVEARMLEHGFYDRPEVHFQFQEKLISRAARMVVDVRLSTGRIGFEEAAHFLHETTGMPRIHAESEVIRCTRSPGYLLGHLLGKVLLEDLLETRRLAEGEAFDLQRFHDLLLQAGVVPISLLKKHWAQTL